MAVGGPEQPPPGRVRPLRNLQEIPTATDDAGEDRLAEGGLARPDLNNHERPQFFRPQSYTDDRRLCGQGEVVPGGHQGKVGGKSLDWIGLVGSDLELVTLCGLFTSVNGDDKFHVNFRRTSRTVPLQRYSFAHLQHLKFSAFAKNTLL